MLLVGLGSHGTQDKSQEPDIFTKHDLNDLFVCILQMEQAVCSKILLAGANTFMGGGEIHQEYKSWHK